MTQPLVLTYHSLDASGSVISVNPDAFRSQMDYLVRSRIPIVSLHQLQASSRVVAITFDDGFENFYEHAFPILNEYRIPATVFVVTGACGANNDWPSQPSKGIPRFRLMDWGQLREISEAGIELGAHTVTHPRLSELAETQIEDEFDRCRHEIEQRVGKSVTTVAYPYGDSNETVRKCARRRFKLGYGTRFAPISASCDSADLPRLDMYYLRNQVWFESLWNWQGRAYVGARGWLRAVRQKIL